MFNLSTKNTLVSLRDIVDADRMNRRGALVDTSSDNTEWYLETQASLLIMTHPAYGVAFYDDEMKIIAIIDGNELSDMDDILNDYGFDIDQPVWLEIGIDQVDYTPV